MSLVPALTEAIAATDISALAGATDWCTHPAGPAVPRVGGTKWPDLDRVQALRPDLVVANAEENRDEDVDALGAAGLPVWVTAPATVDETLDSLGRLCAVLGRPAPGWLRKARAVWAGPPTVRPVRAVVPVWRRPWTVLGRDTFAGDMLRRLGVENVFAGSADRYPRLGKDGPAPSRPISSSSLTSRTRSRGTTAPTPDPRRARSLSAAGTSPGTARR